MPRSSRLARCATPLRAARCARPSAVRARPHPPCPSRRGGAGSRSHMRRAPRAEGAASRPSQRSAARHPRRLELSARHPERCPPGRALGWSVSTLSDLVHAQGRVEADVEWLHLLVGDGSCSPTSRSPTSCSGCRPTTTRSSPSRTRGRRARRPCSTATSSASDQARSGARRCTEAFETRADRGLRRRPTGSRRRPRACARCRCCARLGQAARPTHRARSRCITRHTNLGEARTPVRQELTFNECADDLFAMIASGDFPDLGAPTGPRRGAPRASDGLIRLDVDGITTFASPNALSAFNRMGFDDELEGESLAEVTTAHPRRRSRQSTSRCRSSSPAARRGAPTSRRAASPCRCARSRSATTASGSARSCCAAT